MTGKRKTPAIAEINRLAAVENITAKVRAIHAILSESPLNTDRLARLPPSLAQFNKWSAVEASFGNSLPDVDLLPNGPQTLRKETELTEIVQAALTAVAKVTQGRRLNGREVRVANLEARLALSEQLRGLAENALAESIVSAEFLRAELVKQKASKRSETEKARVEIETLRMELDKEKSRSADLTRSLSNVSRLERR